MESLHAGIGGFLPGDWMTQPMMAYAPNETDGGTAIGRCKLQITFNSPTPVLRRGLSSCNLLLEQRSIRLGSKTLWLRRHCATQPI